MTDKIIENCDPLWVRYRKGFADIYQLHNRSCVGKNICMCEIWRELDAYFALFECFVFQNLDPYVWGRYQKKWFDLYHLYNRSCVDGNIEMCQVLMESDVNLAFYELHGYSKFRHFVGEVPERVDRYIPCQHQILGL